MRPESEWTESQRKFVGSEYPTPKGGVLKVIGVAKEQTKGNITFLGECSICSKDKEVYPNYFRVKKSNLNSGKVPCNCSSCPQLTETQELILMNRPLKSVLPNLTALSVISGRTKRFVVRCEVCNKDKEVYPDLFTPSKPDLYKGNMICGCSPSAKLTDEQDIILINRYLRNSKSNLTVVSAFRKANQSNRTFILTCSICSKDEELWPLGSITSLKGGLKKGNKPCGCSSSPLIKRWQYEIKVKRVCEERGYLFNGFIEPYKKIHTKLNLENNVTGNTWQSTAIFDFLKGHGDPQESKSGFNTNKPATIYINVFQDYTGKALVLKFGITNRDIKVRLHEQERGTKMKGTTLWSYYSEDGKFIKATEGILESVIGLKRVGREVMPDGFTESVYHKPFVEKFMINYLEMLISR